MRVRDIMNTEIASVEEGSTMQEAALRLARSQASDLMVVNDGRFVGVLSEGDLIRAVMPRFDELMFSSGSLTEAFEVLTDHGREFAGSKIDRWVIRDPMSVRPDDQVLRAAATMVSRQIRRLPVVDDGGCLVGTVSRADVALAVLHEA